MSDERYQRQQVLRPTAGIVGCHRNHCSPEERVVIEAAVRQREVYLKYGEAYHEYDTDLRNAVDALLAARAKEGNVR